MTVTYTAPPAVTNLAAQWHETASNSSVEPGILVSWTAPQLTDNTTSIGGYLVYVLLKNTGSGLIEQTLYTIVRKRAQKDSAHINSYSIGPPPTEVFFPFSWNVPNGYEYTSTDVYSFHVVAFLTQSNDVASPSAGVTIYRPNQQAHVLPSHLNPRLSLASSGEIVTMQQDDYEDVASCVEMVLNTPRGLRSALPNFGIDDPTFTQVNTSSLHSDIQDWEPRAIVNISIFNDDSGSTGDTVGAVNANVNIVITDINYMA